MKNEDARRRLAAKRNNESVKLSATSLNAVALAILGAAIIVPGVNHTGSLASADTLILLFVAFTLHLMAHLTFRLLRSEE
ncbi:hypothetical protein P7D22_21440 [Lichenihabitans sp. Uapishka_5]|uniref:hypothetical protein n=1 Tax=Lichenihabitans sp. Uapishka_5 TaxID=3037302 RepID=UPI0029E7E5ED|nr:hypothetical protein [Lichenihabitans sp. Uapishka_5]MDX7953732.1 hypothetical protein [Lichenihabitans sp. Uapishka_5]